MGVDYRALLLAATDVRSSPFFFSLTHYQGEKKPQGEPAVLLT
ncbi:hypothetical protein ACMS09_003186 [Cronobacter malonaticus]